MRKLVRFCCTIFYFLSLSGCHVLVRVENERGAKVDVDGLVNAEGTEDRIKQNKWAAPYVKLNV